MLSSAGLDSCRPDMVSRSISLARRRRLLTVPDGISSTVATSVADMFSQ